MYPCVPPVPIPRTQCTIVDPSTPSRSSDTAQHTMVQSGRELPQLLHDALARIAELEANLLLYRGTRQRTTSPSHAELAARQRTIIQDGMARIAELEARPPRSHVNAPTSYAAEFIDRLHMLWQDATASLAELEAELSKPPTVLQHQQPADEEVGQQCHPASSGLPASICLLSTMEAPQAPAYPSLQREPDLQPMTPPQSAKPLHHRTNQCTEPGRWGRPTNPFRACRPGRVSQPMGGNFIFGATTSATNFPDQANRWVMGCHSNSYSRRGPLPRA